MLEKVFKLKENNTTVKTEITAGITTFMTMAYILAVNPSILSEAGMNANAVLIATCLASFIGTALMALMANMPFALSAGMGLNAYLAYTVVLGMGVSWQLALFAVFVEGLIFVVLSLTNVREAIFNAIPLTLKKGVSVGIGLFIAFIGLQNAGIIVNNDATLVSLGEITKGSPLLAIIGLIITGVLVIKDVRGAMLIGVLATAAIGIPMGITNFNGLVSMPHSVSEIFWKFEWDHIFTLDMLVAVFTLLFIDMFDTIGTLVGVCTRANMINPDGSIPRIKQAFMADAIATTLGACLGTSTTTTYIESASGVALGGRSGLTAFVIAVCFAVALFFSPLFLAIPAAAAAPVLIIVGLFMMSPIKNIPLDDYAESIPAFITIIMMPIAYSISDGILLGMIAYVVLNLLCGNYKRITPTSVVLVVLFILKYIFI